MNDVDTKRSLRAVCCMSTPYIMPYISANRQWPLETQTYPHMYIRHIKICQILMITILHCSVPWPALREYFHHH
jgi:hypothetical protein